MTKRIDGRASDELRPVRIELGFQTFAEGSVLIELGNTRILCAVTVEDKVPVFLRGGNSGWITAEYAMLPRSTHTRTPRGQPSLLSYAKALMGSIHAPNALGFLINVINSRTNHFPNPFQLEKHSHQQGLAIAGCHAWDLHYTTHSLQQENYQAHQLNFHHLASLSCHAHHAAKYSQDAQQAEACF